MFIAAVKTFITDFATVNRLLSCYHLHSTLVDLMSQGHWITPEMPAKYTRNRQAISFKGIKEIIASLKAKWEGQDVNSGIGFFEDD